MLGSCKIRCIPLLSVFHCNESEIMYISHKLMMMKLRQLCGVVNQETSEGVGFDYAAFMAERENCSRNSAITYFMRECGVIPRAESVEG